jgi:hypothetical protein
MKKLKIYIPTCDNYLWLIKPFMFLFNKFWDDTTEVVYLGYNPPNFKLPKNCTFISLGKDDNLKYYSDDLRNYFMSIDDEYVITCVDDNFLVDYVNVNLYNTIIKYLDVNKKVGRVSLTRDLVTRPHYYLDTIDGIDIVSASDEAEYRVSVAWSIYKRDFLIELYKSGRTPWTLEKEGTIQSKNKKYDIISTSLLNPVSPPDNAIIFNTNALWRNWYKDFNRLNFHCSAYDTNHISLDPSIINEMKNNNIIPKDINCGMIINRQWYPII